MNNNTCAPSKYDKDNNTCFTLDQIVELSKAYNRHVTKTELNPNNNRINGGTKLIEIKPDKKYLLKQLHNIFKDTCSGNEACITQQEFMNRIVSSEYRDDIINNSFRPIGPEKPEEWLSTVDIDQIMKQYEKVYSDFKFMGAVPSDCDNLNFCSLYSLNFEKFIKNKITKLGIVFNHDSYGEPGSHWVSMFIDIINGNLYYCDSNGDNPKGRIGETIKKFNDYHKNKTGNNINKKINTIAYQKDNSECGVYSCNFIIRLLSGETFKQIVERPLKFNEINSCRNVYFSNKPSNKKINQLCDPGFI